MLFSLSFFVVRSAEHGALVVVAPFSEGATKIIVEVKGEFDLSDASEANPVTLVRSLSTVRSVVLIESEEELSCPTAGAGRNEQNDPGSRDT